MSHTRPAAVVVLAAGEGTRMRSSLPKVLHELAGRSLLGHVVHAAAALRPEHFAVVVGHQAERVGEHLLTEVAAELDLETRNAVVTVHQAQQHGTGHAVATALAALSEHSLGAGDAILVLNGDTPLLRAQTLRQLIAHHIETGASATVGTSVLPDPVGMGRILRDGDGELAEIVEHRDATATQRAITEVNTGVFVFDAAALAHALPMLSTNNDQGQQYLTDVIALLRKEAPHRRTVQAYRIDDYREALGCNDHAELSTLRALLRDRLTTEWMRRGVTMIDPSTVWLDVTARLAPDTVIAPNVQLYGNTVIESGARVGPDTTLVDTSVGPNSNVVRSHAESARLAADCTVGPFAYLRPGTSLGRGVKVGAYVEVKNSELGPEAKVPHLSYIGDATIGEGTNIGASSVVVNYDGVSKHRTTIGRHCRTGSSTLFVAPVTIGDGAYTAAGSVITSDVPAGALGVARATQRNIAGWVFRRRAGTAAANAAQQANADHSEADHPKETSA
ncbi:MAG TPA: bifunctional UDP-N-acetylglucosamine diphosphorylase/glucosamine-1-phosphate N-acetyltransferase GlmU [Mycobacteriales bacterium]|nr:bifunctional UDP-N-acetylglucosamine diphosphorylase/glucosamine-1-phosphate N-acetyltransferase GlmU [Mycobacteriales bacterium]